MTTIMVWMLIAVSGGGPNHGTTTVVGHFKTAQMCQHVLTNIPNSNQVKARCIQAEIIK